MSLKAAFENAIRQNPSKIITIVAKLAAEGKLSSSLLDELSNKLLWQSKIDELFDQIILWLEPFKELVECKIVSIPLSKYNEDKSLNIKDKTILRVTFSGGKYVEFMPFGPYSLGYNDEECFAKVTVRLSDRRIKMVIVLTNLNDSKWNCANMSFDKKMLYSFLFN